MSGRYARLRRPRRVLVSTDLPWPALFLGEQLSHALNHGLPARRRSGPLAAAVGRRGLPAPAVASLVARLPHRPAPATDAVLDAVREAWPTLVAAAGGAGDPGDSGDAGDAGGSGDAGAPGAGRLVGDVPARLAALEVDRSGRRFVFVFADDPHPLLVLKSPDATADGAAEAEALTRAAALGLAPRCLGRIAGLEAQEGLAGRPLWVRPPGRPGWSGAYGDAYASLGSGLERLASATAVPGGPDRLLADAQPALPLVRSPRTRLLVEAALRDVRRLTHRSLQHHDLSAQNWLVRDDALVGLVDWDTAMPDGVPGHDALHAAVSLLEHGVGLRSRSPERVLSTFTRAWHEEPLLAQARRAHRACLVAATGSEALADRLAEPLQLAFFARRLGWVAVGDGHAALDVDTAERMLDHVARG